MKKEVSVAAEAENGTVVQLGEKKQDKEFTAGEMSETGWGKKSRHTVRPLGKKRRCTGYQIN